MLFNSKIYIAGHQGMVGSALFKQLKIYGYSNLLTSPKNELDLRDQKQVQQFFALHNPEYVFIAAAKVGGIWANNTYPADFIYDNLAIQTNIIHEAWRMKVKRLLFLGSSCIYPRDCPQPMQEKHLLSSMPEATNRAYTVAKIAGIEMCWAYNKQYHTRFLATMPSNLYGPGDHYDLNNSHVIPALIQKFHDAKVKGKASIEVWGSGNPKREFLYSEDLADACIYLMNLSEPLYQSLFTEKEPALINIGCGKEITIRELAELIAKSIGYSGNIFWDSSKPDGAPRKLVDTRKFEGLNWQPKIPLKTGLKLVYQDYISRLKHDVYA